MFYGEDGVLESLLQESESGLAPIVARIISDSSFGSSDIENLRLLAVLLHFRTRKQAELFKVPDKKIAYEVIKHAIEKGDLPEPEGGWKEGMMDFGGVPAFIIKHAIIPSWLEMSTLGLKLLKAASGSYFITSDNPVSLLNPYCDVLRSPRSFAGFSRTGFQLVLPISPAHCLFFYDPKVYKIGVKRANVVTVPASDVESLNILQLQGAECCLYYHDERLEPIVKRMAYSTLITPIEHSLRILPGKNANEEILHIRTPSAKIVGQWHFCRLLSTVRATPGSRRDEAWTKTIDALIEDIELYPNAGDLSARLSSGRIFGHLPSIRT